MTQAEFANIETALRAGTITGAEARSRIRQINGTAPLQIGFATNRERWLNDLANRLRPTFKALGAPLPERIRIAIGFTSTGKRSRRIGECWAPECSQDRTVEVFIVPNLAENPKTMPLQVAAVLAHELVHAGVGCEAKHGPKFAKVAKALGLQGKMTATVPGPEFIKAIEPILLENGPLPHARLVTGGLSTAPKKQENRHVRVKCPECGYLARVARQWLRVAPLSCPVCDVELCE